MNDEPEEQPIGSCELCFSDVYECEGYLSVDGCLFCEPCAWSIKEANE